MKLGPQSSTTDVLQGVDLSGRTVVITGGSGGLGFATAHGLAAAGAAVVLLDKAADRGVESVRRLRADRPAADVEARVVDLTDPVGLRAVAADLLAARPRIDVLINNAGAVFGRRTLTPFGWEATLATNFLGHFLLTGLLRPALPAEGRVVNVGSGAHRRAELNWGDPHFAHRPYVPRDAYAQSKTAVALFTHGLHTRFGPAGPRAFTVRPGVVATGLYGDLTPGQQSEFSHRVAGGGAGLTPPVAAATTVWAATAAELDSAGGGYLAGCAVVGTAAAPDADGGHAPWIFDTNRSDRLWRWAQDTAETLLGHRLPTDSGQVDR
jgi:NAD(P)-dependent dehydrogenase (short-subunit alcohol dehydrogenase family)